MTVAFLLNAPLFTFKFLTVLKMELRKRVKLQRKERGVEEEKPLSYTEFVYKFVFVFHSTLFYLLFAICYLLF